MNARCPHCGELNKTPSRLLRLTAVAGAWAVILAMLIGLSLASLFAVPIVPIVIIAGAALVTSAHHYAFGDRLCVECGRAYEVDGEYVEPVAVEPAPARVLVQAPAKA